MHVGLVGTLKQFYILNKSNTECGIIRLTNTIYTWDQIHYMEVRPYQNVKSIRQAVFKISRSQAINCCGGHLGFRRMPQINSVRGLSSIKAISKCEVNPTSGFQDIAFTSNKLLWRPSWFL